MGEKEYFLLSNKSLEGYGNKQEALAGGFRIARVLMHREGFVRRHELEILRKAELEGIISDLSVIDRDDQWYFVSHLKVEKEHKILTGKGLVITDTEPEPQRQVG